jgi:hypothetical protein
MGNSLRSRFASEYTDSRADAVKIQVITRKVKEKFASFDQISSEH